MKPCFKIENRSKDYTASYTGILIELSITDESGTENSDSFSLKISDVGNSIELPKRGERITASIGTDGKLIRAGNYVIDEIKLSGPPDIIEITGKAAPFDNAEGQKAMQSQKSRSWDDVTIGALVQEIATDHGLTAAISSDLAQVKITHLDQTNESDNNLLTRLARTYGAVYKPTCNRLVFASGNDGKTIAGDSLGSASKTTSAASSSDIESAIKDLPPEEAQKYRDAAAASSSASTASSGGSGTTSTKTTGPELTITRGAGMKFNATFSKRTEFAGAVAEYHNNDTGDTEMAVAGIPDDAAKVYRDHCLHPDKATAEAACKSKLKGFKRGSQTVELDLPGLYMATAEQRVVLTGFRTEICGEWVAKKVEFNLSKSAGLRTKISLETPGDGSEGESARSNLLGNSDGSTDADDDSSEEESPEEV